MKEFIVLDKNGKDVSNEENWYIAKDGYLYYERNDTVHLAPREYSYQLSPDVRINNQTIEFNERAITLLLEKQKNSYFVVDLLQETVFYDDTDCDGFCLLEDIDILLEDVK